MNQESDVNPNPAQSVADDSDSDEHSLLDLLIPIVRQWRVLVIGPLAVGVLALAASYLIPPIYTSRTVFLPPQAQQSSAASALASLGALTGLVGAAAGIKSSADQYVALMLSTNVADKIVEGFDLMSVYDAEFRFEARKSLSDRVRIGIGKRDGLITVEVDDEDPARAAAMANRYVDELRRLTSELALTEAQQRRVFFEAQLTTTKDKLMESQVALQASGFTPGALKAEPRAAAEEYARARASATAAEIKLRALRERLADSAPEVQQQLTLVSALRAELRKLESSAEVGSDPGYIARYREFKYQEAMFDLFARQFELARLDESREGALIQIVDVAVPAEWKSKPRRAVIAIVATLAAALLAVLLVIAKDRLRVGRADPETARKLDDLRNSLAGSSRSRAD